MPRHEVDRSHPPVVIRGYAKLCHVEELIRRGNSFLRVTKFIHVTLPLLSWMEEQHTITVTLKQR